MGVSVYRTACLYAVGCMSHCFLLFCRCLSCCLERGDVGCLGEREVMSVESSVSSCAGIDVQMSVVMYG